MPPTPAMMQKLAQIEARYRQLGDLLGVPETLANPDLLRRYGQELSGLDQTVKLYRALGQLGTELAGAQTVLAEADDPDLAEMAREEVRTLEAQREQVWQELRIEMLPADPNDDRDVIVEIRAGAGGDEAALFAADLFRMYGHLAEHQRWRTDIVSLNDTGIGGYKEVIFQVHGRRAYSRLKYESGVHRVQRVPTTEASGRIHTSTATVAVLPVAEEVEVNVDPDDLDIDVYRAQGHGGQSVNTTDSAVRITHRPTGMVVTCQDERSQLKNRLKALTVLRARLLDREQRRQASEVGAARRGQVGTGDRSEKIRTYNFPQDRLTDHRLGLTVRNLTQVLDGGLDEIISALAQSDQAERLAAAAL